MKTAVDFEWLESLPISASTVAAIDALRGLIPGDEDHIDIDLNGDETYPEMNPVHSAAALMLIATAAFHNAQLREYYGTPTELQRATSAFHANTRRELKIELHGSILNGKLNGSMRIFR